MNNFESLEYNKAENHLFWIKRKSQKKFRAWHWFMKWGTCLAIGVFTALISYMVGLSTGNFSGFKYWFSVRLNSRSFLGRGFM